MRIDPASPEWTIFNQRAQQFRSAPSRLPEDEAAPGFDAGHLNVNPYEGLLVQPRHPVSPHVMPMPQIQEPLDPAVARAMGSQPAGLHPLIQQALEHVRSMNQPQQGGGMHPMFPGSDQMVPIGYHPQVDRIHAIHATQDLAARMAALSQRSLRRNQYGGRH